MSPPMVAADDVSSAGPILDQGLAALGLDLGDAARDALLRFVALLRKWNRVHNLTSIEHPGEIVTRHLLDSLSVLPFVQGRRVIDIGSGAGFPGLPLALARPESHFTLLDSREKRTRFLRQAVAEMELRNVEIVSDRAEHYAPAARFDTVVTRAFGSIADFTRCAGHLRAPGGVLLAMKGTYPAEELADGHEPYSAQVVALRVPMLDAERHVVVLKSARPEP
ncbi:MAG: 16S rRNA (guanine(527)-N(7))-methyltransferase RsmG [Acidiferrobacteraceae bacterium]